MTTNVRTTSYSAATGHEIDVSKEDKIVQSHKLELKGDHVVDMDVDDNGNYDPMAAADSFMHRQRKGSAFKVSMKKSTRSLQFDNLGYTLEVGKKKNKTTKHILKDISGDVNPGEVLAIMGSSGAGKTSLLNMLAGRLPVSKNAKVSGEIKIDGLARDWKRFDSYAAYVLQEDRFFPEMTVRETISFSATLRLPTSMPEQEKNDRVDSIIDELGLAHCQHSIVGNEMIRGISGGERKRVNIGTELVSDPSLLFLDEPTSGLDSFNAQNVMLALQVLAKSGRTVIATIHQPRSNIYSMFDKILLLSKGQTMYFGQQKEAVNYFTSAGFPCPPSFNPADFFVDLISADSRSPELDASSTKRIDNLALMFKEKELNGDKHLSHQLSAQSQGNSDELPEFASSVFLQSYMLFLRSFRMVAREKLGNFVMIFMNVVFGIFLGFIWLDIGGDGVQDSSVQAIGGALFFGIIHNSFNGVFGICNVFPLERNVVLKERASKTYRVAPYFLSKCIAEIPRTAIVVMVYVAISYYMIGLRPEAMYFFRNYAIILLTAMSSEGIAYMISAGAKDPQTAAAAGPGPLVLSMLFGGFFIGVDLIPPGLKWLRYLSFIKYAFAAIMQNEFEGRILNTDNCDSEKSFCPGSGEAVLENFNLQEFSMRENIGILICFVLVTRILAFLILLRNVPKYVKK